MSLNGNIALWVMWVPGLKKENALNKEGDISILVFCFIVHYESNSAIVGVHQLVIGRSLVQIPAPATSS